MLILSLRLVHFIFMAMWFGASLFATRDVRTSIAAGPTAFPGLRDRMKRTSIASMISGPMVLLTGLGLIFAMGGFAAMPKAIHIALGLAIVMSVVGAVGVGGTWDKIDAQLTADATPEKLAPLVRRLAMFGGIFHGLWTAVLVLMVFRYVIG
ncbi:MAG: hypothetical protein JNG84_11770 [Archangium sp.]|nr:hypothetical protein [Archangium sp.]